METRALFYAKRNLFLALADLNADVPHAYERVQHWMTEVERLQLAKPWEQTNASS